MEGKSTQRMITTVVEQQDDGSESSLLRGLGELFQNQLGFCFHSPISFFSPPLFCTCCPPVFNGSLLQMNPSVLDCCHGRKALEVDEKDTVDKQPVLVGRCLLFAGLVVGFVFRLEHLL